MVVSVIKLVASLAVVVAITLGLMSVLHVFGSGLEGNDESSHVLNGYMIWSYLAEAFGQNPMAYAKDFYVHYPKISIGHWPPLYYTAMSLLFFVSQESFVPLMVYHVVLTVLPAVIVVLVLWRQVGPAWSLAGGVVCALLPLSVDNSVRFMLDQTVAVLAMIGLVLWLKYCRTRATIYVAGYALTAAAAVLVKGNGWLLGLFPAVHILLTFQFSLLRERRLYVAGLIAILLVAPWYALTYSIAADGFNYSWGLDYFDEAFPQFLEHLKNGVGWVVVVLAVVGALLAIARRFGPDLNELALACFALVLTTLLFHSIVPVDIVFRYMSTALPAMAVLAIAGAAWISDRIAAVGSEGGERLRVGVVVGATIAMAIPGLVYLVERPGKADLEMDLAAEKVLQSPEGATVVIDAHPGGEGALAYEIAIRDTGRLNYVVRSSDLLASSDFMANRYALTVDSPEGVLEKLEDLGAGWVVVAAGAAVFPTFDHSKLLAAALDLEDSPYELMATFPHRHRTGDTRVYGLPDLPPPDVDAVRDINFAEKAAF